MKKIAGLLLAALLALAAVVSPGCAAKGGGMYSPDPSVSGGG